MGAGPLPLGPPGRDEHRRRPPIAIAPVDTAAAAAAAARGLGPAAVWLAAVTGGDPPVLRTRTVDGEHVARRLPFVARHPASGPALGVAETAFAVDAGREQAANAAADGVNVLVGRGDGRSAAWAIPLTGALTGCDPLDGEDPDVAAALDLHAAHGRGGPLGALRRLGDGTIAVLCGAALGAGEHGLGFACDGSAATAAAAVAAAVEPDLGARLLSVGAPPDRVQRVLLAHLGIDHVAELAEP